MLFQNDLNEDATPEIIKEMIADRLSDRDMQILAWDLYLGTRENRVDLDRQLQQIAEKWNLERMATTDRSILRLGAYELLHTNTPLRVVIDEAVRLAKKFGDAQSSQFVNGVLDRLVPEERRQKDRQQMER
ncbi:UNVERIFIED_CONTAM: hypothetical protein GTU68_012673 [Idotea baltica]|nr:hypothetical protein [Idotea baltica]